MRALVLPGDVCRIDIFADNDAGETGQNAATSAYWRGGVRGHREPSTPSSIISSGVSRACRGRQPLPQSV